MDGPTKRETKKQIEMADSEIVISVNLPKRVIEHGLKLGLTREQIGEECAVQLEAFLYNEIEFQQEMLIDMLTETLDDFNE